MNENPRTAEEQLPTPAVRSESKMALEIDQAVVAYVIE